MSRTTWIIGGAIGAVLGCGKANNAKPAADTTATAAPAPSQGLGDTALHRTAHARRERERTHHAADSAAGEVATKAQTIPSGTILSLTSNQKVCTNTNHPGDTFTATVSTPIPTSTDGTLPSGSSVTLGVTQVKPSDNVTQHGQIGIAVDSLNINGTSYPLDADVVSVKTTKVRATSMGQEATKTGIGTAAGAILGAVIGHSAKTALIGAAAGTAAGAGTAYATTKYDFCIPQGGAITTKLTSDASVRTGT